MLGERDWSGKVVENSVEPKLVKSGGRADVKASIEWGDGQ